MFRKTTPRVLHLGALVTVCLVYVYVYVCVWQVTLEGQLQRQEQESLARQRELETELRQREDEVRELQGVQAEVLAHQETQETLRAEREELRQRLGSVEQQLALSQAVSAQDQVSRVQELVEREAQLTSDLRQQAATIQALEERVRVAQESLSQTTQVYIHTYIHTCMHTKRCCSAQAHAVVMLSCLGTATDFLDVPKQLTCMNTALLSDQLERTVPRLLRTRMHELGDRFGLGAKARGRARG